MRGTWCVRLAELFCSGISWADAQRSAAKERQPCVLGVSIVTLGEPTRRRNSYVHLFFNFFFSSPKQNDSLSVTV